MKATLIIDMPKTCTSCPCSSEDGFCRVENEYRPCTWARPGWCPLKPYQDYISMESEQTLWGLPIDEARKVIEVYKYAHKMPSKDYQEGFEDGIKYMNEHINSIMTEQFKSLMVTEWEKENDSK